MVIAMLSNYEMNMEISQEERLDGTKQDCKSNFRSEGGGGRFTPGLIF
jgi:seryl-tRNA synthetase